MDDIEEIETFSGLTGFCNFCGVTVDPFRKLSHVRDDRHRELTSTGMQSFEEKLLLFKSDLLSQTEDEFNAVKDIVVSCEKTLKSVSDQFLKKMHDSAEEEAKKKKKEDKDINSDDDDDSSSDESDDDDDDENKAPEFQKRILRGVMRAGALANGLLMRDEREVLIIVSCEEEPTFKLLRDLHECFLNMLPMGNGNKKYSVELKEDEACLLVRCADESLPITCRIGITSTKCRTHPFKHFNDKSLPNPEDMLPRIHCEESLRALRRARWFESKCYSQRNCEAALKILRDFCERQASFSPVDYWMLQVLFYKVISASDAVSLNLVGLLQRFFECLSSGILFPDGPGLYDPCEREPTDLCSKLTIQQKLNITSTAQKVLRMIAFKQLQTVFAVSKEDADSLLKPPAGLPKRRHPEGGDNSYHEKRRRS